MTKKVYKRRYYNLDKKTFWCKICSSELPESKFYAYKDGTISYYCIECTAKKGREYHKTAHAQSEEYRRKKRNGWLKRYHKITLDEYEQKLMKQGSKCAICDIDLKPSGGHTHLDHDHKTGKLREFLCTNCNRALGHFQDNVDILKSALDYLKKHNVSVDNIKEGKCL